jgi:hypothetical protein
VRQRFVGLERRAYGPRAFDEERDRIVDVERLDRVLALAREP